MGTSLCCNKMHDLAPVTEGRCRLKLLLSHEAARCRQDYNHDSLQSVRLLRGLVVVGDSIIVAEYPSNSARSISASCADTKIEGET